jgi:hypothetical protein
MAASALASPFTWASFHIRSRAMSLAARPSDWLTCAHPAKLSKTHQITCLSMAADTPA